MDPNCSAQEAVHCTLCTSSVATMFCEVCDINLCKDCIEIHVSDSSKAHKVISLKQCLATLNYPKCGKHEDMRCELHCEQCNISVCAQCISSKEHKNHDIVDILKYFGSKKEVLHNDLQELEESIFPSYQEIASKIPVHRADLSKNSQTLTTDFDKQGEEWHKEIENAIMKLKSDIEEMVNRHQTVLNKHEDEIAVTITEIRQSIADLKKLQESKDICHVTEYESRNAEFRRLLPNINISLPNFTPLKIDRDQFLKQFGSLSAVSFATKECSYNVQIPGAESSTLSDKPMLDIPKVVTTFVTEYEELRSVAYLNDNEVWTCGDDDNIITLYNIQGELLNSITTQSKKKPFDIAVKKNGILVYTVDENKTVNVAEDNYTHRAIRLRRWEPSGVCVTTSGDLLVVMYSGNTCSMLSQGGLRVVRYSGFAAKQSYYFGERGETGYVCENRNLDICVSFSSEIVVVNQAGKHRFTYSGPESATKKSFSFAGIATDSQCKILTIDDNNSCIHILDQNGTFLRFISNRGLRSLSNLCVDNNDNILVTELYTGKVKKVQYYA